MSPPPTRTARPAADPVAHPDAVGPRRDQRLRPHMTQRPATATRRATRAAARGLRRPPGPRTSRRRSRRGRSARACGPRRSTPAAAPTCALLGGAAAAARRVDARQRARRLGHRPPPRPPGCGAAGAPSCLGTPAPPVGNSPPRLGATRTASPAATRSPSSSSPPSGPGRPLRRRVRDEAVLRRRMDGTDAMRRAALLIGGGAGGGARPRPRGGGAHPHRPRVRPARRGHRCLFPWPNDFFTRPDRRRAPGRRLALTDAQMPRNARASRSPERRLRRLRRLQPGPDDRREGARSRHPGRRSRDTGAVPLTDMARPTTATSPSWSSTRGPASASSIWAELDANASTPADTTCSSGPARNWPEGHRYIVALRDLRDADGRRCAAGPASAVYRDGIPTDDRAFERRRAHMESLFRDARRAPASRAATSTWPGTSPWPAAAR